jgi:hypothetical protein
VTRLQLFDRNPFFLSDMLKFQSLFLVLAFGLILLFLLLLSKEFVEQAGSRLLSQITYSALIGVEKLSELVILETDGDGVRGLTLGIAVH